MQPYSIKHVLPFRWRTRVVLSMTYCPCRFAAECERWASRLIVIHLSTGSCQESQRHMPRLCQWFGYRLSGLSSLQGFRLPTLLAWEADPRPNKPLSPTPAIGQECRDVKVLKEA